MLGASEQMSRSASRMFEATAKLKQPPCPCCGQKGYNGAVCKLKDVSYLSLLSQDRTFTTSKSCQEDSGFGVPKHPDYQQRVHQLVADEQKEESVPLFTLSTQMHAPANHG